MFFQMPCAVSPIERDTLRMAFMGINSPKCARKWNQEHVALIQMIDLILGNEQVLFTSFICMLPRCRLTVVPLGDILITSVTWATWHFDLRNSRQTSPPSRILTYEVIHTHMGIWYCNSKPIRGGGNDGTGVDSFKRGKQRSGDSHGCCDWYWIHHKHEYEDNQYSGIIEK